MVSVLLPRTKVFFTGRQAIRVVAQRYKSAQAEAHLHHMHHQNGLKGDVYPAEKMGLDDLNENVLKAKYAVRGAIPMLAAELESQLQKDPNSVAFDKIVSANIGNPQQLQQKPLTFYRQVLSLLQYPDVLKHGEENLIKSKLYQRDAIARAKRLLNDIGTVGAYSSSQGVQGIRETVAKFITRRDDGEKAYADDIYLTAGASSAVSYLLSIFCKEQETGVLIPIPQYPLYTATLALNNSHALPYYLDEQSNWSTSPAEIEEVVNKALERNIKPSVLVVINPGNPTGAVLSVEAISQILSIAAKYGILVIADEVYQENVFHGAKFHSMKKVLRNLQREHPGEFDNVQLASLHSTSKGVSGECGQRGGYMEVTGLTNEVKQVITKLASISLCPVVTGQALVDLMVSPPQPGDDSYEVDQKERKTILASLAERAAKLHQTFNSLEGIECQRPEGAMYLFPKLLLPQKAIIAAEHAGMTPDAFYCKSLLEATGICTVPGAGFGQEPGTYHLRTTFLAPGTEWIQQWEAFHKSFYEKYQD
ncbi:probable Probable alanine aminotransferase, mitochondrial [Zygosaccharomyces bailii]|uniref:Glutamate pyruvate transaminase n=1 Tax=Zygosaccharomyces bailii (strain CLIB 213 / ATCC 58445 / CBS 680 / BCRC 21525 / NBRC 1098 / NCYC 1416 / NRRL Y-2227) TaxID=1333698 RepID=A0A8J2T472_ZYGB2|nr:BN860_02146g1_1 [Zygosaccharomyces bailii CLIB 213]CDH15683.1 probable alanine aminotransferase, mitochondrial [Zygosaccharomyces bailii ISA1307]SJM84789.1 probable Probable alanine aminotransferase, mitochondrial [Zygosaccharomyces bailii]